MVRDAEAAAQWYADVFGLRRWLDTPFTLSGVGLAAGQAGNKTRLIIMQCQDPMIGMIGLLQWVDPPQVTPPVPQRVEFGAPIFVMASDDVRGVFARAQAAGGQIYTAPYEWSFTAPDGTVKRLLSCSVFDLDGYFYEVNETL